MSNATLSYEVFFDECYEPIAPVGTVMWVSRGATLDCVTFNDATLASHTLGGGVVSAAAPTANAVYVSTGDGLAVIAPDWSCPS